jgi:hypothetical protein
MHLCVFTLKCIKKHLLVIAPEANHFIEGQFLKVHEELNDPAAIRASIDVITEKDELRPLDSRVLRAEVDEPLKVVQAAMNVPNGICFEQCRLQGSTDPSLRSARGDSRYVPASSHELAAVMFIGSNNEAAGHQTELLGDGGDGGVLLQASVGIYDEQTVFRMIDDSATREVLVFVVAYCTDD